jgi:hypothetical protein
MVLVYSFCNGNGRAAAVEYRWQYPRNRVRYYSTFSNVYRTLREMVSSHGGMQNVSINGMEMVMVWVQCSKVHTEMYTEYP